MKRVFCVIFALLLFGTGVIAVAGSGRESTKLPPQEVEIMYASEDHGYQQKDINDVVRFKTLPDGSIVTQDASGTTDFFVPSDRVVYITSTSQLSTWSGQSAINGQSYFQTAPGKIYMVDLHAIASTGCAPGGTTAMGSGISFSGVSAILPNAASYEGPAYDVQIMLATTGATGDAVALTGITGIQVWPFAGNSALTAYGKTPATYAAAYRSSCTPQTLMTVYGVNGTIVTHAVRSGASYWEIDKLGESAVFGMENSAVSAFVKQRNVFN